MKLAYATLSVDMLKLQPYNAIFHGPYRGPKSGKNEVSPLDISTNSHLISCTPLMRSAPVVD